MVSLCPSPGDLPTLTVSGERRRPGPLGLLDIDSRNVSHCPSGLRGSSHQQSPVPAQFTVSPQGPCTGLWVPPPSVGAPGQKRKTRKTLVFLSECSLLPARPLYVMILKYIRSPGLSPDSSPPHWASLHLPEVTYKPVLPPPRPHTVPTRSPHLSPTCLPTTGSPGQDRHRGSLHPPRPLPPPTTIKVVVLKHRPDLIFPWAPILME